MNITCRHTNIYCTYAVQMSEMYIVLSFCLCFLSPVPTTSSSSPLPVTSEEGTTSSSEVEGESRTMSTTSTSTSSTPVATREPLNVENEGLQDSMQTYTITYIRNIATNGRISVNLIEKIQNFHYSMKISWLHIVFAYNFLVFALQCCNVHFFTTCSGLSSQQIVLYIVVPLCMVLIVGIIIGVIIVIVLVCRSRRSTPEKGISSIVHCTTAFTGNVPRGGRSQSFVANPHARESVYDTLNGELVPLCVD